MNFNLYTQTETQHMTINQSLDVRQLGKSKQDHAAQGAYDEDGITTRWSAIWDGHGNNHVINHIRKAPLNEIMKSKTPAEILHQSILCDTSNIFDNRFHSGSTMVWVKETEFSDHREIEIGNVGDSQAVLFINHKCVFISKPHNASNPAELERLFKEGRLNERQPIIQKSVSIEAISDNAIITKKGSYFQFENTNGDTIQLAGSQSLGHEDITGVFPDVLRFRVDLTDSFRVVLCSDGITDVMSVDGVAMTSTLDILSSASSPKDVVDEAERRWKQVWTVMDSNRTIITQDSFPKDGYDDCVCVFMDGISLSREPYEEIFYNEDLLVNHPFSRS